ncbi:unnamed protein product [Toxocara canis]|uniref:Ubiquitin-like protein ATG12 n=1 Tax=Toxocara canis TaxID=6265 RepID=A0A183TXI9_TOXCA|nr:unnamed protein product [Toxocara canis]
MSKVKKGLDWYYLQYCLVTGLYMFSFSEEVLEMSEGKVEILLKAVGDAPIMKQSKWVVDSKKTIAELTAFVRQYLKVDDGESVFLFVNQCFAPSPDQTLANLAECFASANCKLVLHYSKTSAWG